MPIIKDVQTKRTSYRPEIDGLRAVAILAVVIYHLHAGWLPGGFVGVDIFFVISGYLITLIILREIDCDEFSFWRFFIRRVRRIFPAVAFVLTSVLVFQSICEPFNYDLVRRTGIWVLGLASNIYVWMASGDYFSVQDENPLLHTWSLGIEEQFYIAFPVVLLLIAKVSRRRLLPTLVVMMVLSLVWCMFCTRVNPAASFYLVPSRAWELLIGCTMAVASMDYKVMLGQLTYTKTLTYVGATMISSALLFTNPNFGFPGWQASLPTVGSALVIGFIDKDNSACLRILRSRGMVFIGKISFSLYLWHWPVLLAVRNYFDSPVAPSGFPSGTVPAISAALSFGLAWASYRLVEAPFRSWRFTPVCSCLLSLFLLLGMIAIRQSSLEMRFHSYRPMSVVGSGNSPPPPPTGFEPLIERGWLFSPGLAIVPPIYRSLSNVVPDHASSWDEGIVHFYGNKGLDVMVIGDSHAVRLSPMLDDLLRARRLNVKYFCYGGQRPDSIVQTQASARLATKDEHRRFQQAQRRVLEMEHPRVVIWASRYDAAQFEDYVASLELVLKESRCIFVQQPPVLNFGLGLSTVDWLGIYNHRGFNVSQLNVVEKNSFLLKRNSFESKLLTMFGRSERFTFLPTEDVFSLPEGRVRWWDGGSRIYYIDLDHLSAFGVDLLKEKLGAAINAALN